MRVGLIGTGAIAEKHAQAYANIGFELASCSNRDAARGAAFADRHGCRFVEDWRYLCADPGIDFVDVCTLPGFRVPIVEFCATLRKPVQLQKPIAVDLESARKIVESGALVNVVSQHRFDEASQFLKGAIAAGRLGRILQADAYIKWFRPDSYYAPAAKGTWEHEGGGALINQGIHSVDLLLWMVGPVRDVAAQWQLGAVHSIESEDVVNALVRYESGATGVIQASTAFRPGYPERLEIHGTLGSAVMAGDRLVAWDVVGEGGQAKPPAPHEPSAPHGASGASDPGAISLVPFERQFLDFAEAILDRRAPLVSAEEGYRALELVTRIYRAANV